MNMQNYLVISGIFITHNANQVTEVTSGTKNNT